LAHQRDTDADHEDHETVCGIVHVSRCVLGNRDPGDRPAGYSDRRADPDQGVTAPVRAVNP
jgi:hypothetical protein